MKAEQKVWSQNEGWVSVPDKQLGNKASLVFIFASETILTDSTRINEVRSFYPNAFLFGCTTAGEIYRDRVIDDSLVLTAVEFEKTTVSGFKTTIRGQEDSRRAGSELAGLLMRDDLQHIFVLSDGLSINGTELVKGFGDILPENIKLTGGLSGDGDRFHSTRVLCNDRAERNCVAALGFYGKNLNIGFGTLGGWDPFGPERLITKSHASTLYEMDGKSALNLYKMYLGKHAEGLPATGLLFPLSLRLPDSDHGVVRTILSVNEEKESLTFAGDVPEGSYARLMKANFDRLIDGSAGAARNSILTMNGSPDLALLISCVGRKMILKQRVEEEVESAGEILGQDTVITGFYSYGEISPSQKFKQCRLHNQTMTITTFQETVI